MSDFGRYSLSYEPSDESWGCHVDSEIQMSISAEADLERMCDFFESFLRASGYVFDGTIEIVSGEKEGGLEHDRDFWREQTFRLLRPEE